MATNLTELLISVENPRFQGRNKGTGRFHSFKVKRNDGVEEWNVGFGHKIPASQASVRVGGREIFVGPGSPGLTESQARQLLEEDIQRSRAKAAKMFNKYNPLQDGTQFHQLRSVEKDLMTEIVFNVGTLAKTVDRRPINSKFGWPNLAKAMYEYRSGNKEALGQLLKETERKGLTDRNEKLKKYFGANWEPQEQEFNAIKAFGAISIEPEKSDALMLFNSIDIEEEEEEEEVGAVEEQEPEDTQEIKLDSGIYERPNGTLFQITKDDEVREIE